VYNYNKEDQFKIEATSLCAYHHDGDLLYDTSRNGIIGTQKGCIENGESFHTSVLSFFIITLSARLKE